MPEYEIKHYATKLKKIASLLSGIPIEKFSNQQFKTMNMPTVWDKIKLPTSAYNPINRMTVRKFLQLIGTDALRDNLHENVWVNALFADYKPNMDLSLDLYPNWIIPDVRFPNEADAIIDKGGIIIRVERDLENRINEYHPSEVSLDNFTKFSFKITNNGNLWDLEQKALDIIKEISK